MSNNNGSAVRLLSYEESAFVILIYSLISIVAAVGNLTVVFIIIYFQRLRTPTNFLILNLAIADFLMAALNINFSYWPILILQHWPFGLILCKAISFSQAAVVMSSAYTLVAISIDRFIAIVCPLKPLLKLTKRRSLIIIMCVWLLASVIASPLLIVHSLAPDQEEEDNQKWHCVEDWTSEHSQAAYHYSLVAMVLQYFFPLGVLLFTYGGIGLRLWYSKVPGESGKDVLKGRQNSVKKMIPTMFIVTATYAICWLPLNVLNILTGNYASLTEHFYILYIWFLCHFMSVLSCMANPIIYVSRNKKFRDGFRFCFRWLPCVEYVNTNINVSGTPPSQFTTDITSAKTSVVTCTNRASFVKFRKNNCAYAPVVATSVHNCGDNHFL